MKKILILFLVTLLTLSAFALFPAGEADSAPMLSQDIEALIFTDKEEYNTGDEILMYLSLKNNSMYRIEGITVDTELPSKLKVRDGEVDIESLALSAGEVYNSSIISLERSKTTSNRGDKDDSDDFDEIEAEPEIPWIWVIVGAAALLLLLIIIIVAVKRKKTVNVVCLLICGMIMLSGFPIMALASDETVMAQAVKTITVGKKQYDIKVTVTWTDVQSDPPADGVSEYTKGEWIYLLATYFGIEAMEIPESNYVYGDSRNSTYGLFVETFELLGLLPEPDSEGYEDPEQDIPLFEEYNTATREFAAYTVYHVMGFEGGPTVSYIASTDAGLLKYPDEVGVLVEQGFFTLNEMGEFEPDKALTQSDVFRIGSYIESFNESLEITEADLESSVKLLSSVVEISSAYEVTVSDIDTYSVTLDPSEASRLDVGTVFVMPTLDGGSIALKVIEKIASDSEVIVVCTEPETEEVVREFSFAGYGSVDLDSIGGGEDVTAVYDPNGEVGDGELSPFDVSVGAPLPGKITYTLHEKELGNSGIEVSGKIDFSIPDVSFKAKGRFFFGILTIDELMVSLTRKAEIKGELSYDFGVPETSFDVLTGDPTFGTGKIEIDRITLYTDGVFTLDIVVFLNVDLEGQLTVGYTIVETNGFQYRNGSIRLIKDFSATRDDLELNADAKIGLGVAPTLTMFTIFDLAGFEVHGGIGAKVAFTPHIDSNLYCGSGYLYAYATMELARDTALTVVLDLFGIEWSWDIFDEDNTPWCLHCHLENGKFVPDCTYVSGWGDILGSIKSAETGEAIGNARVRVYNADTGELVSTVYTQSGDDYYSSLYKGEFLIEGLPVGKYDLNVQATGYKTYNIVAEVLANQRIICEAALMMLRDGMTDNGTVKGNIINALTGEGLSDTSYELRDGWNNTEGECIDSGEFLGTQYQLTLPAGYYTLMLKKTDFTDSFVNIIVISGETTQKDITVSPNTGIEVGDDGFRIVLTWGYSPSDLDSHFYYFTDSGYQNFHIYYWDKAYGDNADLDVDDTTSYGPETTTLHKVESSGKYSFYVHDYSNKSYYSSRDMSNSGAQVKLYSGGRLVTTFNIPANRAGTVWHVFDINAATGEITFVNGISNDLP